VPKRAIVLGPRDPTEERSIRSADGARQRGGALTGGGVGSGRNEEGAPPGRRRRRRRGGCEVVEPPERGEGATAASAQVVLHRGRGGVSGPSGA
jgi:hypothetical protein